MLFQVKSWRSWRSLWVRILALHDIYLIINDWVGLGYLIFVLITLDNYISLLHAMIIIWAFQLLVFQVFVTLRLYMTRRYVPPEVVVFFSVYKVRHAGAPPPHRERDAPRLMFRCRERCNRRGRRFRWPCCASLPCSTTCCTTYPLCATRRSSRSASASPTRRPSATWRTLGTAARQAAHRRC